MMRSWIRTGIATGLLTAGGLAAETLYEKDGIALEGSVRMAGRNAAICQVLAESESAKAYEQNKAHHGRPLHVWRVDYSAFNGSSKPLPVLKDLLAAFPFRIRGFHSDNGSLCWGQQNDT